MSKPFKMKVLFTFLSVFCFTLNVFTQDVKLFTYWKTGDTQDLVVKEGFVSYEADKIIDKEITTSNVRISVLAETDTSYTVEWLYKDSKVDRLNVEVIEDPIDQRIEEMFSSAKLVYRTDEFGTFKEMLNMEELMKSMADSIDVLAKEMDDLGDEEDVAMFSEMMKGMLASEAMQEDLTRDIWNYHYYLGGVYQKDTLVNYEEEMENKMGGTPIPVNGTIVIETDLTARTIAINDSKIFQEVSVEKAIKEVAEKLKAPKKKQLKKELKNNTIEVNDIENYTYDIDGGWLKYYERNRIYQTKNARKERFLILEAIEN